MRFCARGIFCLAVVFGLSLAAAGQAAAVKVVEPDLIGVFFYPDPGSQTLKKLPKEEFKRHAGAKHFIYSYEAIQVPGEGSSFRIPASDEIGFVFTSPGEEISKIRLFKFDANKGNREYSLGTRKGRDYIPNTGLSFNVKKYGESSYKLIPENPLQPGEYALTFGANLFTFGVAGSGK